MILGEYECDEETKYFLKYGKQPPVIRKEDREYPIYTEPEDFEAEENAYREFQQSNLDEYFDWAACWRFAVYK